VLEVKTIQVHTNPAIQGVSSNMGFADQSFFGKFFKKNTDLSLKKFTQNSLDETFKMNKYNPLAELN
jgi:YesN/AraC family two-component response regulator